MKHKMYKIKKIGRKAWMMMTGDSEGSGEGYTQEKRERGDHQKRK